MLTRKEVENRLVKSAKNTIRRRSNWIKNLKDVDWYNRGGSYGRKISFDMKWYPRLGLFKSNNDKNVFNPETMQAYSYRWWRYLDVIKGKVVFNDFTYSSCTSKHQSKLRSVLHDLGIKVDVYIEAPQGLQDLSFAMEHEFYRYAEVELKLEHCQAKSIKMYQSKLNDIQSRIDFLKKTGVKLPKAKQKYLKQLALTSRERKLERQAARRLERQIKLAETQKVVDTEGTQSLRLVR